VVEDFIPEERLHPASWLFAVVGFIRQFLIPLIFAAVFGPGDGMPVWIAWAIVPMIGAAVLRQLNYRYGFAPNGLVIREGILFRNVRQIDYRRIENVDTQRNPLHRLLGVAEVRIETSTGGKPEAQIEVLSLAAAQALRERLSAARSEPGSQTTEAASSAAFGVGAIRVDRQSRDGRACRSVRCCATSRYAGSVGCIAPRSVHLGAIGRRHRLGLDAAVCSGTRYVRDRAGYGARVLDRARIRHVV
jgi:uncharacterized membrane protein YdbT with pleckstrin-like domain